MAGFDEDDRSAALAADTQPSSARSVSRELDRGRGRVSAILGLPRLALRVVQIFFWTAITAAGFPFVWAQRRDVAAALGASLARLCIRLGATFIKIGQIASTRPDLFPPAFLSPLAELQDRVDAFSSERAARIVEEEFGRPLGELFRDFSPLPVASASIAQVHRAVLRDGGRTVAVKIRRPGIVRRAYVDEAVFRLSARVVSWIPSAWLLSPVEAVEQFCDAVNQQLDFRIEADNNRRFREIFRDDPHVVFPALVDGLCTDRVLTMDFIDGVKEDKIRAIGDDPSFIAKKGMEVVCRMIYQYGLVHADLHPGNLLFLPGNRIALLDVGLVARLTEEDRRRFTLFNFFVATGMGREAAAIVYEQAPWKDVPEMVAYERDVADFVAAYANHSLDEVSLTLVIGKVFDLLRRHRVQVNPHFTMVNVAMMVVEGLGRKLDTDLVPTLEARPILEMALGLRAEAPRLVPHDARQEAEPEPAAPVAVTAPVAPMEADRPFVGREDERKRLAAAIEGATAGRGRLVLLAGEPGIGKTRMTEQAVAIADARGLRTLVARCHEAEGTPAYWPWVQAVRTYAEAVDRQTLEAHLGSGAVDLVQIVPELRERLRDVAAPPPLDAEQARFRLFDGFVAFLKRASESRPLLLVLDDLHWADKPTLLLLLFVAREIAESRIAIVGSYRETEVRSGHPLADVLPSLRRERVFERLPLRGLADEDVHALVAALSDGVTPSHLAATIARETEGNPLFVEEMVRQVAEASVAEPRTPFGRGEVRLPASIREAIERRLRRLHPSCRELLAIASVIGRSFDVDVLARLRGVDAAALGDRLDESRAARIVDEERGDPGRLRFSHGLIRETLYETVPAAERSRRHDEIGRVLESMPARIPGRRLAELAYHFAAAAGGGELGPALDYAIRAGDEALGRIAHEEAAEHYQRALGLLDARRNVARDDEGRDASRRCELLLKLGEAQSLSMPAEIFHATFREAAEIAESIGSAELFARAVFGYGGPFAAFGVGRVDRTLLDLCERALRMLPGDDSAVRARLCARLAEELNFSAEDTRREELARESIAMARRLGDRRVLAEVLVRCQLATARPDNVEERLAMVEEIVRLSLDAEDLWLEQQARAWAFTHRLEIGDADGARRELEACERAVRRSPTPLGHTWARASASIVALLEGRIEEAGHITKEVAAMAERGGAWGAGILVAAAQSSFVQLVREGMQSDQIERLRVLVEHFPGLRNMKAAMAMLYAFQGDEESTRRELERAWPERLDELRRDAVWLPAVLSLVEAVVLLRDEKRAALLYDTLAPFESHCVVVPLGMCFGSTSRLLGGLAGVLRRWELAEQHFERSLAIHRRMSATLWYGLTCFDYARMLLARDRPSDGPRARALTEETLEYAHRMGVRGPLLDRVLELEKKAFVHQSAPAAAPPVETTAIPSPPVASVAAPPSPSATTAHGTVTLLFSDIEGLTELTEKLGDSRAFALLQAHDAILRGLLPAHEGREVDTQRDGFLFAFTKSSDALRFALAAQSAFAHYRAEHPEHPLCIRMGVHAGEPIRENDRFFGRTVILTSRIAARARGNEIRVSSVVRALAEGVEGLAFDAGEEVELKGLGGRHRIYTLLHEAAVPAPPSRAALIEQVPGAAGGGPLFRREGDYWTVRFDGRTSRMKDSKGMRYLARLLERPGEDIHVVDLLDERAGEPEHAPTAAVADTTGIGLGDAGDLLDAQARGQYRRRLDDLAEELEEARRNNDAGRIESLEHEIEFLTRELSAAFGLGGRARKVGNVAERARKAVSNRIRVTLERITREHESLGNHLSIAVRLGTYCCYTPETPISWNA